MKRLLIVIFLLAGFTGFGQSKKELNRQLRAEYKALDSTVDSLVVVYGAEKAKEKQLIDSFRTTTQEALETEKPFMELMNDMAKTVSDLKLLGVKTIEGMDITSMDSLVVKFSRETVSTIVSRTNRKQTSTFFGFSKYEVPGLDSYSKKEQNTLLQMLTDQRQKEKDLLIKHINEAHEYGPTIHEADSALNFLRLFRQFFIPQLNEVRNLLDKELSKQRMAYMKTGPTGFPLNYHRVFPDVFPETGPEIDFNNQPLETVKTEPGYEVYADVEEPAAFPGGNAALTNYMKKNLRYPPEAIDKGLEGKCYVKFLVSASGEISEISIMKGVPDCEICDREAIRFIKSMPDWIPGKVAGHPVNSYFTMPILFKLN